MSYRSPPSFILQGEMVSKDQIWCQPLLHHLPHKMTPMLYISFSLWQKQVSLFTDKEAHLNLSYIKKNESFWTCLIFLCSRTWMQIPAKSNSRQTESRKKKQYSHTSSSSILAINQNYTMCPQRAGADTVHCFLLIIKSSVA